MKRLIGVALLLAGCSAKPALPTVHSGQSGAQSSNQGVDAGGTYDPDDGTDSGGQNGSSNSSTMSGINGGTASNGSTTGGTTVAPPDDTALYGFDGAFPVAAALMATNWTFKADGLVGWGSTNNFTALLDYMYVTGSKEYYYTIETVFNENVNKGEKNFINEFYDDTGWWGLAWVRAYDITQDQKYLNAAKTIADYIWTNGWSDKQCGGGIWWKRQSYKSAISNALYMKLAASLHNRIPGDTQYLENAKKEWKWFTGSGLIDSNNLVVDGINEDTCKAGGEVFSYNEGVILGAAAELYTATKDQAYIDLGKKVLAAGMKQLTDASGVLEEKARGGCSAADNHGDELLFKGAYIRNVREFNQIVKDDKITAYFVSNAKYAWDKSRSDEGAIGYCWQGPFDKMEANRQTAALDLMTAAVPQKVKNLALNKKATSASAACKDYETLTALTDGTNSTKWCTGNNAEGVTVDVDLGSIQQLHRIRIAHAGSATFIGEPKQFNTKDFEILVADAAEGPWRSVAKVTGNTASGTTHPTKEKAQFIRLHITNAGSDNVIRIYELIAE